MRRLVILSAVLLAPVVSGCREKPPPADPAAVRIISYSPAVTDILYALGLGDNLVGVTSWCILPDGASKPIVGSQSDVNEERILSLRPSVIFIQQSPGKFKSLKSLMPDLSVISLKHDSLEGILTSIRTIGRASGASERAERLVTELRGRLDRVRGRVRGKVRPRVLFVMGYDHPSTCGAGTYLDEIIRVAGGVNAAGERFRGWPMINADVILSLRPDVLICQVNSGDVESARRYWGSLSSVPAVAQNRVYVSADRRLTIFGSGAADVAEQFAEWIHGPATKGASQ